jgi:hypothetical protein
MANRMRDEPFQPKADMTTHPTTVTTPGGLRGTWFSVYVIIYPWPSEVYLGALADSVHFHNLFTEHSAMIASHARACNYNKFCQVKSSVVSDLATVMCDVVQCKTIAFYVPAYPSRSFRLIIEFL